MEKRIMLQTSGALYAKNAYKALEELDEVKFKEVAIEVIALYLKESHTGRDIALSSKEFTLPHINGPISGLQVIVYLSVMADILGEYKITNKEKILPNIDIDWLIAGRDWANKEKGKGE